MPKFRGKYFYSNFGTRKNKIIIRLKNNSREYWKLCNLFKKQRSFIYKLQEKRWYLFAINNNTKSRGIKLRYFTNYRKNK